MAFLLDDEDNKMNQMRFLHTGRIIVLVLISCFPVSKACAQAMRTCNGSYMEQIHISLSVKVGFRSRSGNIVYGIQRKRSHAKNSY